MFGFDDAKNAYSQVQDGNHASLAHEAIAGAAAFEVCNPALQADRLGHEGMAKP